MWKTTCCILYIWYLIIEKMRFSMQRIWWVGLKGYANCNTPSCAVWHHSTIHPITQPVTQHMSVTWLLIYRVSYLQLIGSYHILSFVLINSHLLFLSCKAAWIWITKILDREKIWITKIFSLSKIFGYLDGQICCLNMFCLIFFFFYLVTTISLLEKFIMTFWKIHFKTAFLSLNWNLIWEALKHIWNL